MPFLLSRVFGEGEDSFTVASRSSSVSRKIDHSYYAPPMSKAWMTPRVPTTFVDEDLMSKPPSSALTVASRLGTSPAYRSSLVTTSKSSEHSAGEPRGAPSLRACRQLLVSAELAYLSGPTGSVAQESTAQSARPSSASVAAESGSGPAAVPACDYASQTSSSTQMYGSGEEPLFDESSVRSLLNVAWPRFDLDSVRHVAPVSTHLQPQRIYELRVSPVSGAFTNRVHGMLMLVLSPPSMLRLLRSEQWIVKSEAVVVKWIRSVLLAGGSTATSASITPVGTESDGAAAGFAQMRAAQRLATEDDLLFKDMDLSELLPALIDHSQSARDISSAYNILSHLSGLSLSSFSTALSISERSDVDFQAGRLVRRLSDLPSPSGRFGPAISVLCPTAIEQSRAGGSMGRPGGMDSWSLAFHAMLEGVLRDAEDMAVTIPYQTIRRHFRRLSRYLDEVTVPRLVIIDAAHDSNLMAKRTGAQLKSGSMHEPTFRGLLEDPKCASGREWAPDIRITGLRYWSNCVFGDPLVATVFNGKPSRDFLRGFEGRPRRRTGHDPIDSEPRVCAMADDDPVELQGETHVRLLLYQCYHATVAVVKEFYRPHNDSTIREFAARKRLNAVLARLNDVETGSKRSHVRPSGETSSSKKLKTDNGSDWSVS